MKEKIPNAFDALRFHARSFGLWRGLLAGFKVVGWGY